jgi:CheY-like chemotaxis protein
MDPEAPAGLTLLVAENNRIRREGLAAVPRQQGGPVALAVSGKEAPAHLREHPPPDLILLDMMLPRMDGWKLLGELKKDPALAAVPVLITTAVSSPAPSGRSPSVPPAACASPSKRRPCCERSGAAAADRAGTQEENAHGHPRPGHHLAAGSGPRRVGDMTCPPPPRP